SLTTRLSAYFLTALALVLLGFSTVLYLLVRHHLVDHTNQRLETAMQTLIAAVEVHADDVQWEPLERHITLGEDPAEDQVRWMVHDASGRLVDCSRNLESGQEQGTLGLHSAEGWRVLGRRLQAGRFDPQLVDGLDDASQDDLGEGIAA